MNRRAWLGNPLGPLPHAGTPWSQVLTDTEDTPCVCTEFRATPEAVPAGPLGARVGWDRPSGAGQSVLCSPMVTQVYSFVNP